jgi:DNA anti-recombination protein RmuC
MTQNTNKETLSLLLSGIEGSSQRDTVNEIVRLAKEIAKEETSILTLTQKDIDMIERITYKSADDIAVAIARSFERLEERFDAMEARLFTRIIDMEDEIAERHQQILDKQFEVTKYFANK